MGESGKQTPSGSDPGSGPGGKGNGRLLAAYAVAAALAFAALVAVVVVSSRSATAEEGNPHINLDSGATNGVAVEVRTGIEPEGVSDQKLRVAARRAGCDLRLRLRDEGNDHIPPSAPEPNYATNPPTSGDHTIEQQADGAYREAPDATSVVHSLEHRRIAIQYRPGLPAHAQRELIGLYDTMYGGALLFPNPNMPYQVAATTWTNLLGCPSYQEDLTPSALRAFGKATWGKFGGEPLIAVDPYVPTPSDPSS